MVRHGLGCARLIRNRLIRARLNVGLTNTGLTNTGLTNTGVISTPDGGDVDHGHLTGVRLFPRGRPLDGILVEQAGVASHHHFGFKLGDGGNEIEIHGASRAIPRQFRVGYRTGQLARRLLDRALHMLDRFGQTIPTGLQALQLLAGGVAAPGHVGEHTLANLTGFSHHAPALGPGLIDQRGRLQMPVGQQGFRRLPDSSRVGLGLGADPLPFRIGENRTLAHHGFGRGNEPVGFSARRFEPCVGLLLGARANSTGGFAGGFEHSGRFDPEQFGHPMLVERFRLGGRGTLTLEFGHPLEEIALPGTQGTDLTGDARQKGPYLGGIKPSERGTELRPGDTLGRQRGHQCRGASIYHKIYRTTTQSVDR